MKLHGEHVLSMCLACALPWAQYSSQKGINKNTEYNRKRETSKVHYESINACLKFPFIYLLTCVCREDAHIPDTHVEDRGWPYGIKFRLSGLGPSAFTH